MRNTVLMVIFLTCIFDVNLGLESWSNTDDSTLWGQTVDQSPDQDDNSSTGYCTSKQCDQIQIRQQNLASAVNQAQAQSVANLNAIEQINNLIQTFQTNKEYEALEQQCELVFPYGALERYQSLVYIWVIPGANASLASPSFTSPEFSLPTRNYTGQTQIQRNNNSQYVMSTQFKGIATAPTEMPAVHYLQVDPSGQCLSAIYTDMFLFGGYLTGYNYFRPLKNVLSAPYLTSNDTVTFNVHVESTLSMQNVYSYTGILVDKVEDYSVRMRRIQNGLAMFYYGPYFYTAAQGYKINVRVYPGGQQKLTFLVCFLLGQFDAQLSANFAHTTTVTVYNQKNPALFLNSSVQQDLKNNNYYAVDVTVPQNFEEDYLVDDTLFYKVVIQ